MARALILLMLLLVGPAQAQLAGMMMQGTTAVAASCVVMSATAPIASATSPIIAKC